MLLIQEAIKVVSMPVLNPGVYPLDAKSQCCLMLIFDPGVVVVVACWQYELEGALSIVPWREALLSVA